MENEEITEELLGDWVEIQSAYCTSEAQLYKQEDSVVIKDCLLTDSALFPPRNHEDLPIETSNQDLLIEGQSKIIVSTPSCDQNGEGGEGKVENKKAGSGRWIVMPNLGLSSVVGKIVEGMIKGGGFRASIWIWWFASATTGVGALALVLVLCRRAKKWQRQRQRRVQPKNNLHHLMLLIKSKDQKISQLLLQVSQLNDMLLARRRVRVLQVA